MANQGDGPSPEVAEHFGEQISSVGVRDLRAASECEMAGEPVDRVTGQEHFDSLSRVEQDELLGPDVAEAVRTGKVKLEDLTVEHRMETEDDFIAQATPQDLGIEPSG